MTPRDLDDVTLSLVGKRALDCTADELTTVLQHLEASAARLTADADRAQMVLREATVCGCRIQAPLHEDGSADVGCGRVVHTCQQVSR